MKSFIVPMLLVLLAAHVAKSSPEVDNLSYETKIDIIRNGLVNAIKALQEEDGFTPENCSRAIGFANATEEVIKTEAQNPKIVANNIKIKLNNALSEVKKILNNLKEFNRDYTQADTLNIGIKNLKSKVTGLKTGLTDIFKTPTDLKNAVHAVVVALIEVLERKKETVEIKDMAFKLKWAEKEAAKEQERVNYYVDTSSKLSEHLKRTVGDTIKFAPEPVQTFLMEMDPLKKKIDKENKNLSPQIASRVKMYIIELNEALEAASNFKQTDFEINKAQQISKEINALNGLIEWSQQDAAAEKSTKIESAVSHAFYTILSALKTSLETYLKTL